MSDVRIIHGDCLDVLPTLEAGSVDAIVTDPPYGTDVPGDGYGRRGLSPGKGKHIEGDADLSAMAGMLAEAPRVLKPDGWIALFCSPKMRREAEDVCRAAGFPPRGEVIWDKATPGLGGGIRYQHETVLLCPRGKAAGRDSLFSVIRAFAGRNGRHPHEKPLSLMSELIRYCSGPGDLILDPFGGSGTTAVACLKTGRRCIAVEIDARYIPTINRRLKDAETPLFQGI